MKLISWDTETLCPQRFPPLLLLLLNLLLSLYVSFRTCQDVIMVRCFLISNKNSIWAPHMTTAGDSESPARSRPRSHPRSPLYPCGWIPHAQRMNLPAQVCACDVWCENCTDRLIHLFIFLTDCLSVCRGSSKSKLKLHKASRKLWINHHVFDGKSAAQKHELQDNIWFRFLF